MGKKSGKAGSPVLPAAPDTTEDADIADSGKMAEVKAEQVKKEQGKYGTEPEKPHKAPQNEEDTEDEEKKSWIEIEMVGEDDKPIPGEKYKIALPDDTVAQGTLDEKGFARIEGIAEPGTCKVTFPDIDKEAWGKI